MADPWRYLRPAAEASAEFKDQGSSFLAFLAPAAGPEEAQAHLESLRRRYHDATHHCWAYRVGWSEGAEARYGDDGEPSRTAGPPILSALEAREVSDASLVVVRYFGGVKLGTGGLVRAYRAAALGALDAAELETRVLTSEWEVTLPYGAQGALRHAAAQMGVEVSDAGYGESLVLAAVVPRSEEPRFLAALEALRETWKGAVAWRSK